MRLPTEDEKTWKKACVGVVRRLRTPFSRKFFPVCNLAEQVLPRCVGVRSHYAILPGREGKPIVNTSTKMLPEGYTQSVEINLKKNKRLAIILNIVAFVATLFSFYLLASFAALVRPGIMNLSGSITAGGMLILVVWMVLIMIFHELIHGFFFWVFTRSRPVFAVRLFYAYAGAPAWYIPTRQYAFVAVGPLVIIGAVGMLLMLLAPESWVLIIAFLVALNTGGAIGDIFVFTRLFKLSPTSLANDTGDVVTFYEHSSTVNNPNGSF
jgi:hypothetical protein